MYRVLGAIATIVIIILFIFPATLFDSPFFGLWNNVFGDDNGKVACTINGRSVTIDSDICDALGENQAGVAATQTPVVVQPTKAMTVPTRASAQSTTPPVETDKCVDHEMHEGDTYNVRPDCLVKGDVEVSQSKDGPWIRQYDDDANTGTVVSCPDGCWVHAPFGANVTPRSYDSVRDEMLSNGCDNGCESVNLVTWSDSGYTDKTIAAEPTTPAAPAVPAVDKCAMSIPNGQKVHVPAGCVVSGDVAVNGTVLYDSDQATGLVVVMNQDGDVFAPYGASVSSSDPNDVAAAVDATGCGLAGGCVSVPIVNWPN